MGDYFERIGGFLTYEDFAAHTGEWVEPICVTYRGDYKVCELPPNTQGIAALSPAQKTLLKDCPVFLATAL